MDRHEELADKIVVAFKADLNEQVMASIDEAHLDRLRHAIRDALSQELSALADELEGIVERLRSQADRRELEL